MLLVTAEEAATLLKVKTDTLARWRGTGTGPAWHRIGGRRKGSVRYLLTDLEAFLAASRMEMAEGATHAD